MLGIDKLKKKIDPKNLQLLANEIITDIISRTQSGRDYKGNSFKDYSHTYAKSKAKKFGSSRVNLTRSGNMLNSITWKPLPNGIRLFFSNAENNKKAYYNQRIRKFFALNSEGSSNITKKLNKM